MALTAPAAQGPGDCQQRDSLNPSACSISIVIADSSSVNSIISESKTRIVSSFSYSVTFNKDSFVKSGSSEDRISSTLLIIFVAEALPARILRFLASASAILGQNLIGKVSQCSARSHEIAKRHYSARRTMY